MTTQESNKTYIAGVTVGLTAGVIIGLVCAAVMAALFIWSLLEPLS